MVRDDGLIDAWDSLGEGDRSGVRELIAAGRQGELEGAQGEPIAGARLLPPIPDPEKMSVEKIA